MRVAKVRNDQESFKEKNAAGCVAADRGAAGGAAAAELNIKASGSAGIRNNDN